MNYGQIIERAVRITWRNKVLWLFGIALALFGGMHGGNAGNGLPYAFGNVSMQRWAQRMPSGWEGVGAALLAVLGLIVILALVWAIIGVIVRYTSMGALIGLTAKIEAGETPTFRAGVQRGWGRLLGLFGISLIIGIVGGLATSIVILVFIALGALIALPAIAMFGAGGAWVAVGVVWCVALGVAWLGVLILIAIALGGAFQVTQEYAYRACVLQEQGIFDAIGAGVALLRARLKETAAMWLLLAAIRLGLGLVLLPIVLVVMAGAGLTFGASVASARSALAGLLIGAPLALLGGLVMLLFSGVYAVFQAVVWTLFYQELRAQVEV